MSQKSKSKRRKRKPKTKKADYRSKKWFEVYAPESFDNKKIGEIIGLENNVLDRTVETLLYDFTDNYDDISCKLRFKVINVNTEAQNCYTTLVGHEYTSDYIRSLVGRGATKITTINNFTAKDEYIYRLTTVCVTIRRARSSQQDIIRKIMRKILNEFSKNTEHEKFIRGMIFGEFENQIKRIAKTIYPLSSCTIIKSKLISMPEGGTDKEIKDEEFDIVEIDVERSRKSEIRRSERINVKKYAYEKKKEEEEESEEESEEDSEEEVEDEEE